MKLPQPLRDELTEALRPLAPLIPAHADNLRGLPRYAPGGTGKLPERVRWDALWAAKSAVPAKAYALGANDAHIDTALRASMRELGLPEFAT